jgi:hypothetical protein
MRSELAIGRAWNLELPRKSGSFLVQLATSYALMNGLGAESLRWSVSNLLFFGNPPKILTKSWLIRRPIFLL